MLSVCTWRYSFQSHLSILLYIVSNHINPAGNYRNRYIQSACSLYLLCRCSRQPISLYSLFRELVLYTRRLQNEFQNRKENQLLSGGNDSYVTGDICIDIIYKTTCNCRCIWGNCSFRNWNDFVQNSDLPQARETLTVNKRTYICDFSRGGLNTRLYTLVSNPCSEATNIGSFIYCELSLAAESIFVSVH